MAAKRKPAKRKGTKRPQGARKVKRAVKPKKPANKPRANKPVKKPPANKPVKRSPGKKSPAKKQAPRINLIGPPRPITPGVGAIPLPRELGGTIRSEVEAEAALEAGDVGRAIALYTRLIDATPSPIASFLIARGRAYYQAGDHRRAIADFERGLALEPNHPDLHFDKGKAELQAGLVAEAEQSFTRDLALDPSPSSFYNRHLARKAMGDQDGALSDLDAAIHELPDEPALRISRAIMRHTADDHEGAFEDAEAAATLEPHDLLHLDLCARFALLAGRDGRAAEAYRAALELAEATHAPPSPQHLHGYALALAGLGREMEALPLFDRAIALAPDDPTFLCNRGWTLHGLGRDAEALADLDRAIAYDPSYEQALRNRAALHVAQGDHARALADYRTLASLGHDVSDQISRLAT